MSQQTLLEEAGGQIPVQAVFKSKVLGRVERRKGNEGNQCPKEEPGGRWERA